MTPRVRPATPGDRDLLVKMMEEFYAESGTPFETDRTIRAFDGILQDERIGRVWILERRGTAAGYVVLTVGFSMEYSGRDAFIDDLFVRREHRGYGLGHRRYVRGGWITRGPGLELGTTTQLIIRSTPLQGKYHHLDVGGKLGEKAKESRAPFCCC
ncbi:MAG: GNAT family N-acetyltransferase [Candidatus Latescibacteria bacterium]|nr:GNAT family N-acetyltransferase [Candidatus Latescibacterota bacterium]NIT37670.1 GNAT family N-acetyltransferase [Candidatus Latescibacterota bacterium]